MKTRKVDSGKIMLTIMDKRRIEAPRTLTVSATFAARIDAALPSGS
ncbi:MAG TPA: hypothetical protein VLX09_25860 [Stellaceae bacterium]|nr:hypothetical protein [Stellaceae bacterium]